MDTELRYGGRGGPKSTKGNRRIETNAKRPPLGGMQLHNAAGSPGAHKP